MGAGAGIGKNEFLQGLNAGAHFQKTAVGIHGEGISVAAERAPVRLGDFEEDGNLEEDAFAATAIARIDFGNDGRNLSEFTRNPREARLEIGFFHRAPHHQERGGANGAAGLGRRPRARFLELVKKSGSRAGSASTSKNSRGCI